jgi:superfamily II DNA helicase RecQ
MTYILSSMLMKGFCIVVSPLVSLMLDQLEHLPLELTAACVSSLLKRDQQKKIA